MMTLQRIINANRPPASHADPRDMEKLGVGNLCRAAKFYNSLKSGSLVRERRRHFRQNFETLIEENGPVITSPSIMEDGWALDTSGKLPHLEALLGESEEYIKEFGMQKKGSPGRAFIRDILKQDELTHFPSFLNFILSSDVLTTVCRYLKTIPMLSNTIPPGVRFVESSMDGQAEPGVYQHSQLYHLDLHDSPLVYVIVLLRDVTIKSGPFTFLSASASLRAKRALRYFSRRSSYRVTDEKMFNVIDRSEEKPLIYPRGTVLFLDSSQCFHFGSRDAEITRYQMMYGLVSPCRSDFTESFMTPRVFPVQTTDSQLRHMVCQKNYQK